MDIECMWRSFCGFKNTPNTPKSLKFIRQKLPVEILIIITGIRLHLRDNRSYDLKDIKSIGHFENQ